MDWKTQYEHLFQYAKKLELENNELRNKLGLPQNTYDVEQKIPKLQLPFIAGSIVSKNSSPTDKIKLFRSLFRGREDVYAKRWYSFKTGKNGYAPVYEDGWSNHSFAKIQDSSSGQESKKFRPLTNQVIYEYLYGADFLERYISSICWSPPSRLRG